MLILCSGSFLGSENGNVRESLECVDSRYLYRFSMSLQTLPILHVSNDSAYSPRAKRFGLKERKQSTSRRKRKNTHRMKAQSQFH